MSKIPTKADLGRQSYFFHYQAPVLPDKFFMVDEDPLATRRRSPSLGGGVCAGPWPGLIELAQYWFLKSTAQMQQNLKHLEPRTPSPLRTRHSWLGFLRFSAGSPIFICFHIPSRC